VTVSWEDAQLFCQWLTAREQAAGRLAAGCSYRLPSDHEWSCAVELGEKEDAARLPSEKSGRSTTCFRGAPNGRRRAGAGNYAGEELQPALTAGKYIYAKGVIAGYNDGFVNTSPVGSFAANRFGLFDMGGNVLQWCEDWFDTEQKTRVLRGSAWNYYLRSALLSATRAHFAPGYRFHYYGFRCVLAPTAAAPAAAAAPILAGKGAGAPGTFLPGQSVDLLALPGLAGLDLGFAPKAHATVIHKEAGRLRIKGDKYSGTIYAPLAVPGGEYELAVGVGKEFGACVLMRIPLPKSHVVVVFNRSGQVGLFSNQNKADLIPAGSAWPAGRPITLRLRVKFGAVGVADELEAKVGAYPSAIWRGRLADYQFDGNLSEGRLGLTIAPDVKTIESFTLRMIQGEATLLPPGVKLLPSSAPSSSPSPEKHGTNVVAAAPATPRPVMGAGAPIDLKFTAIDGRKVDLETLRGKVVLVDFWASWCQPCMLEIPHVVEAYHRFHDKGFEVVGISFDEDKAALQRTTQAEGHDVAAVL
jgi:thiol-disulfide isomerase/thioredoxin